MKTKAERKLNLIILNKIEDFLIKQTDEYKKIKKMTLRIVSNDV